MPKKKFDVWVTRDHWLEDPIRVSNAATTEITRYSGCTVFPHDGSLFNGQKLSREVCLKRYGFLPQPATCWNVWIDKKGVMRYQEYPLLERDTGRTYKPKPIKAEAQYYL